MNQSDGATGSYSESGGELPVEQALLVDAACDAFEVLMVPSTRQNGAWIATGAGGSSPMRLEGGDTLVAALMVASP